MEHRFWRPNERYLGKGLIVHQGTDDFTLNHQVMLVLGSFAQGS
jgi:hypothetical protein